MHQHQFIKQGCFLAAILSIGLWAQQGLAQEAEAAVWQPGIMPPPANMPAAPPPPMPPAIQRVSGEEALPPPTFSEPPMPAASNEGFGANELVDPQTVQPRMEGESYFMDSWFDKSTWDPWEGNVEFGLNGTDGNTKTFNVRLGATAKYKTDWLERALQLTTIQKSANGVTTANTTLLDGRLDWPMKSSPWNYFMHGLWEYDQFKAFDYRLSVDTGFGYEFFQTDVTTLIGRAGIAGSQEFGGTNDEFTPEYYFGAEFKRAINDSNKISFKLDYYPSMSDFQDYRLNSQASWEMVLAKEWGLSMKWSVIDRYDSTPHGAKPNDLDYSTLLIWAF
jgi:putative salt-induced outer membrane protein YdiY